MILRHLNAISSLLLLVFLTACSANIRSTDEWSSTLESQRNGSENGWVFRRIDSYEMTVERYSFNKCKQTIVSEGGVSSLVENSCDDSIVRDVDYLFSLIETRIAYYAENQHCGPNGCECDGPVNLEIHYHIEYNYPMIVIERPFPEYRERSWFDDLRGTGPACTLMGFVSENYYVTSFIPKD